MAARDKLPAVRGATPRSAVATTRPRQGARYWSAQCPKRAAGGLGIDSQTGWLARLALPLRREVPMWSRGLVLGAGGTLSAGLCFQMGNQIADDRKATQTQPARVLAQAR